MCAMKRLITSVQTHSSKIQMNKNSCKGISSAKHRMDFPICLWMDVRGNLQFVRIIQLYPSIVLPFVQCREEREGEEREKVGFWCGRSGPMLSWRRPRHVRTPLLRRCGAKMRKFRTSRHRDAGGQRPRFHEHPRRPETY